MKATLTTAALVAAGVLLSATIIYSQNAGAPAPIPQSTWTSCDDLHGAYVRRFESVGGYGMSRMITAPMLDRTGSLATGGARYTLESVDLIGLLKADAPVVYLVQAMTGSATVMRPITHPGPTELSDHKTRDLTDFEKSAVATFRAGKNIASTGEPNCSLQCAGAVRAKPACLECHTEKKAGDLLGAFTYSLRGSRETR